MVSAGGSTLEADKCNNSHRLERKKDAKSDDSECLNDEYSKLDKSDKKIVRLLMVTEVPKHLAFNRNIRRGYRSSLSLQECVSR